MPAPPRHLALVALSYMLAVAVAWLLLACLPEWHPIARVAVADVAATVVLFGFSRAFDNSSFYDVYWSVMPMTLVAYLALGSPAAGALAGGDFTRHVALLAVVWIWGARLTWNWLRSWTGLGHEDWRYVDFRAQWGKAYWIGSFFAIHLFPTLCTLASCLPLFPAMASPRPFGALDGAATLVALAGAGIETLSDEQLRRYREAREKAGERGAICDVGLWRYSRHPNYFGECTFWTGVWLMGAMAEPSAWWWTLAGPVTIVALFVFGTIPLAEQRSLMRRPEFAEHQRRVSMLVPWPRRG